MRVLECQLSANFLVFFQPAVNHNKILFFHNLTLWIKFNSFFDIFDKSHHKIVKGCCRTTRLRLAVAQPP